MSMTTLACPICESRTRSDYVVVGTAVSASAAGHGSRSYQVLRCRAHDVEFADALPPPHADAPTKGVLRFYGEVNNDGSPRYVDFMDRVEQVARPDGLLHDVGCGNGHLLAEARRRGWEVQGNDVVAAVTPALAALGIPYHVGSLHALDIRPESCDVVTSFCVLPHHLSEPLPDLRAVLKILRPGGWFILQLPDRGPYRKLALLLYRLSGSRAQLVLGQLYQPGGHHFAYTRRNLTLLLRKCGFGHLRMDDYYLDPYWSTRRFAGRPAWFRFLVRIGVYAIHAVGRLTGRANHVFVYAQKTGVDARGPS